MEGFGGFGVRLVLVSKSWLFKQVHVFMFWCLALVMAASLCTSHYMWRSPELWSNLSNQRVVHFLKGRGSHSSEASVAALVQWDTMCQASKSKGWGEWDLGKLPGFFWGHCCFWVSAKWWNPTWGAVVRSQGQEVTVTGSSNSQQQKLWERALFPKSVTVFIW